jgi:hypothetical protein
MGNEERSISSLIIGIIENTLGGEVILTFITAKSHFFQN